jgi:hypothetical protein
LQQSGVGGARDVAGGRSGNLPAPAAPKKPTSGGGRGRAKGPGS